MSEAPRAWPPIGEMTEATLLEALKDPHWRLRHLYWIQDKAKRTVLFEPNDVQQKFLDRIWYRNIVPKARQRGFSTLVQLLMLDTCLFVPGSDTAIIAQDQDTARNIRTGKIMFAYERLPSVVKRMAPLVVDNMTELRWANGSRMAVSSSVRGGTLSMLHVSEYGLVCAREPQKAAEIQEGSLPAVDQTGIIVIESTVESPHGIFADMVRRAERIEQEGRKLTRLDYRLHFASWWDAEEYRVDPALVPITGQDAGYFDRLEAAIGRPIPPAARAWYVAKRDGEFAGDNEKMWRQYPSTLGEAFEVATDGLWLAKQMADARRDGRIGKLPFVQGVPVNTFWDLGVGDDMAIWLHQEVGPWDHFVGFIEGAGEPLSYYVRQLDEWAAQRGAVWGTDYLPHDGTARRPGAEQLKTYEDMLRDLGRQRIEIVPRTPSIAVGIESLRQDFPNYRFDIEGCGEGLKHLDGYAKTWNERMGTWTSEPARNGHQHAPDALRQKAQIAHILRSAGGGTFRRRRRGSAMAT
ncbi:hypothetical protein [Microcystis phage Mwe-JY25]